MNLIDLVNEQHMNKTIGSWANFRTGDTVAVHVKIPDGDKFRIQLYEGVCIAIKEKGKMNGHFRVRKISANVGVERVFPYHCPNVEKVVVVAQGKSRRAKHFYLRTKTGKAARIAIDYSNREE